MTRDDLLRQAAERAMRYLETLDDRGVAPTPEAIAGLSAFDEALPESGGAPEDTLRLLDEAGSPATVASAGRRFFGFVTGGSLPVTVAAQWLATAWDQNTFLSIMSPVGSVLETIAERWLIEILGLPARTTASFVTGATMANFTALAAARHAVLAQVGWDVEDEGLHNAPPVTIIVGDEAHPTVFKSLALLGFGRKHVIRVPADEQGRMIAGVLPAISGPTIVIVQAGNVNTGAFDPAADVIPRAKAQGAWVHVDGAFGLWTAASPAYAHLMAGFAGADSWATDAHKWLNVPYDSGLAFVRDGAMLGAAMRIAASYLPGTSGERQNGDFTPDSSRRARGVEVWAALRVLGRAGVADLVARCCAHTWRFAEGMQAAGFHILNEVVLNQALIAFGTAEETLRVIALVQQDGALWCGPAVWHGRQAMRFSVSSWATTTEDIDRCIQVVTRIARSVVGTV